MYVYMYVLLRWEAVTVVFRINALKDREELEVEEEVKLVHVSTTGTMHDA